MTPTVVPFTDLSFQWREIRAQVLPEIERLFAQSAFCLGPWVEEFERRFAEYLGIPHVVAVNSGTSAVHLALLAAGIGAGDEVLVPSHTFVGSLWGVLYAGARPVLCDVDRQTGTLAVEDARRRIGPRTRAVIAVHLYGQAADMEGILALAREWNLRVIEDAAQSHGCRAADGRLTGTLGDVAAFSFYPGKNLGAAGEAGAVVTRDAAVAERLRALRNHAQRERYRHDELGFNYRMDGIQGLVLTAKLAHLDRWTRARRDIAMRYSRALADLPLELPQVVRGDHVYSLYVVRTPERDRLRAWLARRGVQTGLHYPIPLHRQPFMEPFGAGALPLPESERWASFGLSLPLYYGMSEEQTDFVIAAVRAFFGREASR